MLFAAFVLLCLFSIPAVYIANKVEYKIRRSADPHFTPGRQLVLFLFGFLTTLVASWFSIAGAAWIVSSAINGMSLSSLLSSTVLSSEGGTSPSDPDTTCPSLISDDLSRYG